jgi:hypothetical protein
MIGLSIVGGLAYAAATDGGQGVENFVAGFLGAIAGGYAGSTVANGIQSMLKNPATAEGGNHNAQVNESVKQVQEGKTDRTGLLQSANNSKSDVQEFTAKVEAYAKLNGQEVDHLVAIPPERILGVAARVAEVSGDNLLATSLKITGNVLNPNGPFSLAGGIAGGSAGFLAGAQAGAKAGFAVGWILGPEGAIAGTYIGYGIGGVAGGTAGAIYGSKAFSIFDKPNYGEVY